jgi:hypothetical protein
MMQLDEDYNSCDTACSRCRELDDSLAASDDSLGTKLASGGPVAGVRR